jgi:hypothetical protein
MFRAVTLLLAASVQALHISKGTWHNYPSVDAKAIDARDARRERSERLDAESRGLVTDLRDHVRPVLDAMTNSPALKYDIEAVKRSRAPRPAPSRPRSTRRRSRTSRARPGSRSRGRTPPTRRRGVWPSSTRTASRR